MLQDLADAGSRGASKKRDANEQDWAEFLTALFGFASMLLVVVLVLGRGVSKAERRAYELTGEEAEALATPAGKIIARSWLNARWGKHALGGADWILMALALSDYTERIAPLVQERVRTLLPQGALRTNTRGRNRGPAVPAPAPPSPDGEAPNGQVVEGTLRSQQWQPNGVYGSQYT